MPESNYTYISGDPLLFGSHGETDYLYHSGNPVPNAGVSDLVFESGVGLGGSVVYEGVEAGYFETNETHSEFYNNQYGNSRPHAQGLKDFGMDDQSNIHTTYVFVHRDSGNDSYSLGFWHYRDDDTDQGSLAMTLEGSDGNLDPNPLVTDDDPNDDEADTYQTDSNGNIEFTHSYGTSSGDGVMYQVTDTGFTLTAKMNYHPDPSYENDPPSEWRGRGPDNNTSKTAGATTSFEIQISV
jgi:hypothetical protein